MGEANAETDAASASTSATKQILYLEAYSAGVNAAATAHNSWILPLSFYTYVGSWWDCLWRQKAQEVETWHPIDTLLLLRLQALQWSHGWEKEIALELLHDAVGVEAAAELLGMDQRTSHDTSDSPLPENCRTIKSLSGNVWVIAGSANGSFPASFQADISAYSEYQNRYYLNSMRWNSRIVRGMSEPGIPLIISGQTDRVSWSVAVADEDTEDLYYEEFREVDSNPSKTSGVGGDGGGLVCGGDATPCVEIEVKSSGHWQPADTRIEHIVVAPTTMKEKNGPYSIPHLVVTTSHGPVIGNLTVNKIAHSSVSGKKTNEFSTKNIVKLYANASLCSQALRQPSDMAWLLHLASAENATDFANAADSYKVASMNLLFASAEEIGHVLTGASVKRVEGHVGNVPVSGSAGDFDWVESKGESNSETAHIFTTKKGSILALEEKLTSNDHNLDVIYKWINDPKTLWDRLFLGYDTFSSTALVLTKLILSAPSLSADMIATEPDAETRRKLSQITTILTNFDGKYDGNAIAPPLLEAILENLSSSLLGDVSALVGILRGAPISPLYRDAGQTKLLGTRRWMVSMLSQLNSTLAATATQTGSGSSIWSLPLTKLDSLVYKAVLNAQSWAENELGINKNYKNVYWNWEHLHRTTGKHPASYHTIITSIMSMPALARRGATDTLETTAAGYEVGSTATGNLMEQMQDTSAFYTRGHQQAIRFLGTHGGLDRTNKTKQAGLMAGMAGGQSEHCGSPWGDRKRSVNLYGSLIPPITLPSSKSTKAPPFSDEHGRDDAKEDKDL